MEGIPNPLNLIWVIPAEGSGIGTFIVFYFMVDDDHFSWRSGLLVIWRCSLLTFEGLHIISNNKLALDDFALLAGRIKQFVSAFHLREKTRTARELINGIELLLAAGVSPESILVNDRADVAAAMDISGVQLTYHSLAVNQVKRLFPHLKIGKSVHSVEEANIAEKEGADFLIFGHIYPTDSKPGLPSKGVELLRHVIGNVSLPVIAIGGIKPENTREILLNGAMGIAVMSGVLDAENPVLAAKAYYDFLQLGRSDGML
jgi:thiazole tautomerase (transcriptional regulator TenI)